MKSAGLLDLIADAASRERVLTGTGPLDDACRGGIPLGSRVVIGGAPGAGKTTLATQWALQLARQGTHVRILATDEGAAAIAIRLGQQGPGLPREALEQGDVASLRALAEYLSALPGRVDVLADQSIERAASTLPSDGARALIVDSLQTARSDRRTGNGKKAMVESSVAAIKRIAASGVLTISTSELARDAYKAGKNSKSALGSFKGSGDVEYDIDLGLALVCDTEGKDITCRVEKSRIGERPTFPLYRDAARALLLTDPPAEAPKVRPWLTPSIGSGTGIERATQEQRDLTIPVLCISFACWLSLVASAIYYR